MNAVQLPFLVEGLLIVVAGVFGWWIRRAKKPYRGWKVAVHLFFFAWFTMGYYYVSGGLTLQGVSVALWVPTILLGAALTVQIATGLVLLFVKTSRQRLPATHLTSAAVMLAACAAGVVVAGFSP